MAQRATGVSRTLPCILSSARTARRFVADRCAGWGVVSDQLHTLQLLTSEVVANAVIHGRSEIRLALSATDKTIRVEVGDDNSRHPSRQPQDLEALDGRGLAIVDRLADSWGVEERPLGKVVWFELRR
ncbi:MAG TPA: ATP-binding protein [Mycobacteriales bacterium]|jgi:anti-sigma regulatory factor (Ser/Thr protein kinase)|nr:ATP-binding protein [Mycobacteriales bacterium]